MKFTLGFTTNLFYWRIIRTKIFIIVTLICSISVIIAQDTSLKTSSFVQPKNSSGIRISKNVNTQKYNNIKKIYDKLLQAKGDFRIRIPSLVLRNEESRVASIDYDRFEIVLEEKAYDICAKYGDAALAFLLAHELTHYYEKHAWKNQFVADYSDLSIGVSLRSLEDQIINETQADYLGGFLSYTAGYNIDLKLGDILKELYAAYDFKEQLPGYPSLDDRIELSNRSTLKLKSLIEVFEMANWLTVTGKFQEAIKYYEYILMRYQSREIFNNLGVVNLFNALEFFDVKDLKYTYPIELDIDPIHARDADIIKMREKILLEAIKQFDAAIGLDAEYLPAYLNKAIALSLIGDIERAQFFCTQEVINRPNAGKYKKTFWDAKVLNGILFARKNQMDKAKAVLKEACDSGSLVAKINLDIINGIKKTGSSTVQKIVEAQKFNNGMTIEEFSTEPIFDDEKIGYISSTYSFRQFNVDSLDYIVFCNQNSDTDELSYYMITKPESKSKTMKGIGIGTDMSKISESYGKPKKQFETTQGNIWIYDQLIFILNSEKKVKQWGTYLSKKLNF